MSASTTTLNKSATVLVVDHDRDAQRSLRSILEGVGHTVVNASDPPAALHALHQQRCDLVVVNADLADMDGFALGRLLQAEATTSYLPVVLFSRRTEGSGQAGKVAVVAGDNNPLIEPASPDELVSHITAHLEDAWRQQELVGSNRELGFLADLGRGLLAGTPQSEHVTRRVAGAAYEIVNAALCAAVVDVGGEDFTACVFDREGSAEEAEQGRELIASERLRHCFAASTSASSSLLLDDPAKFILKDSSHKAEYIAVPRCSGQPGAALIVAFDNLADCTATEIRLIDAAAQLLAFATHIASLYEAARQASANLAKEVEARTADAERQRRFTEAIIDSLPISLHAVDRDRRIAAWNRKRELGGQGIPRDAVLGRNIYDVLTKQPREMLDKEFARVFATDQIELIEQETTAVDGETKHWLISKIPMHVDPDSTEVSHVITVGEDITERVRANQIIARAEKLAAVGRLAAGVVHEINNPLATIATCAEALEVRVAEGAFDDSPQADDLREYLGLIRSEAFRCKTITNGLLDFSRSERAERQHVPVQLDSIIESAARLLAHQRRGDGIKINVKAAEHLASVYGDASQLQQAVIALATNAIDAMPAGGTLTLEARNEESSVAIEVSDTGVGIAPDVLAKIFDPFFTTKEVGSGTGLGLAVCYGIVTEHTGTINVHSVVDCGTTFTIKLPAVTTTTTIN